MGKQMKDLSYTEYKRKSKIYKQLRIMKELDKMKEL